MRYIYVCLLVLLAGTVQSQEQKEALPNERIYGRKDGMALTMFVQPPAGQSKERGIILVESGNWKSSYERALRFLNGAKFYTAQGYTVFTVLPGSQPRYPIPDQVADMKRAVRFIRYHAAEFGIDPGHIGITGFSSGGHLSLAVATADDTGDSSATDPVDRVSSRVQAAAVFYPPTDFLNFGRQTATPSINRAALILTGVYAAFDFKIFNDTTRSYVTVTDDAKKLEIARQISPIYSVTPDDPPTLIIHGDADPIVPLQQSQTMVAKLQSANVPRQLIIKKGGGHGWKDIEPDQKAVAEWFDTYLK